MSFSFSLSLSLSLSLSIACPSHRYGQNCAKTCFCYGKAHCDPVTGECICPAGLTGPGCWKGEHFKKQVEQDCSTQFFSLLECGRGRYGPNCEKEYVIMMNGLTDQ